jgi:hypothetical protein
MSSTFLAVDNQLVKKKSVVPQKADALAREYGNNGFVAHYGFVKFYLNLGI